MFFQETLRDVCFVLYLLTHVEKDSAMFCVHCGCQLSEGAQVCPQCNNPTEIVSSVIQLPKKTFGSSCSSLAWLTFLFLFSLCTCGIFFADPEKKDTKPENLSNTDKPVNEPAAPASTKTVQATPLQSPKVRPEVQNKTVPEKELSSAEQWTQIQFFVRRLFPRYDVVFRSWTTHEYYEETMDPGFAMHKEKFTFKGLPQVHDYIVHINRKTGDIYRVVVDGEVFLDRFKEEEALKR